MPQRQLVAALVALACIAGASAHWCERWARSRRRYSLSRAPPGMTRSSVRDPRHDLCAIPTLPVCSGGLHDWVFNGPNGAPTPGELGAGCTRRRPVRLRTISAYPPASFLNHQQLYL
jgi:hypothetical protein